MIKNGQLSIVVEERGVVLGFDNKEVHMDLRKKPLLWGIDKAVSDLHDIKSITVKMKGATFSATRQIITTVNTLAWQMGIKVNGKKQMPAKYSAEPNIT